jgi:tetratricopeptide (TPR) repeat protein
MSKIQSLITLVHSLTYAEKKAFRIRSARNKQLPDYLILYDIIDKHPSLSKDEIQQLFASDCPKSTFETTGKYLFELLLETMLDLRKEQDSFTYLYKKIIHARILYEKSLINESLGILEEVIKQAEKFENHNALLLALRLELDYLLAAGFPEMDEKTLLKKHFKLNDALKYIRKINEQSSLYEILKHRILNKGQIRTQKQKDDLNDLVFSEISLVSSINVDNFEINKLHQLFQSNYLISVGDYQSALNSYYELNNLFEENKQLWNKPPVYYLHTIEGILESLRSIRNYEGMGYFVNQLKSIECESATFKLNVVCTTFLYELFPLLDSGDFQSCNILILSYKEILYDKFNSLPRSRQAEICLYTSLVYFGNAEYHKAHKFLNQIIMQGKNYFTLPLFRTIRLVNLMILYKQNDLDLIKYEIRTLMRDIGGFERNYRIERFLFKFLSKPLPSPAFKRMQVWDKTKSELDGIKADVFEQKILQIFDFTACIESVMTKKPLSEVLLQKI